MFISEVIREETWNGGNWVEGVSTEYGFYSISINPADDDNKHPRLIVVIDDPTGDEESWMRMIPDQEVESFEKNVNVLDEFVENLYDEVGVESGTVTDDYLHDYQVRKMDNSCWQVLYKGHIVGEYSSHKVACKNTEYRIENDWHSKIGDALLEERERYLRELDEVETKLKNFNREKSIQRGE